VFTVVILMVGIGVVAVPTGLLASALTITGRREEAQAKGDADGSSPVGRGKRGAGPPPGDHACHDA